MTRCSNIRFQWPEMSIPSWMTCSFSWMRSGSTLRLELMFSSFCLGDVVRSRAVDAQQAPRELRQLRHDPVELLGHAHPQHGVGVDDVDAAQEDVGAEDGGADLPEARPIADLVHERDRAP